MRKQLISTLPLLLIAATILVTGVAAHVPDIPRSPMQATNAAFRDGMFHGKLDAENGRKLHLSSGRWRSDTDRASYIAGYQQGTRLNHPDPLHTLSADEIAAYHQGINDGRFHRNASQPFQADKAASQATPYERQAYASGYQVGYYVDNDSNPTLQASNQD